MPTPPPPSAPPAVSAGTTPHKVATPGLVVAILALAGISVSLMQTLVIPIVGQLPVLLSSTPTNTSWAITATLLAGAVVTPIAGRLGDMIGKRPVLLTSLAMMVAGSVVCAFADSLTPMIVGRALQGFAAGVIPLGISLMRDVLPAEKLGPATAVMSASLGVGGALGLPAAALIADNLNWHALFWVAAGLGLVVFVLIITLIPGVPRRADAAAARFDLVGAVGLSATLILLLLGVSKGADWGWTSATTLTMLIGAVVLAVLWGVWELRTRQPLVDLRTVVRRQVLLTNIASLVFGYAMFGMSLALPQIIQLPTSTEVGLGGSMLTAGLAMIPGGLMMLVTAAGSARVTRVHGPKVSLMIGAVVVAAGYTLGAVFMDAIWQLSVVSGVIGAGIGFAYGAMPALIMSAVPANETAAANSFNTLVRAVGSSVASAVAGAVLASTATVMGPVSVPSQSGFRTVLVIAAAAAVVALLVAFFLPGRPTTLDEVAAVPATPDDDTTDTTDTTAVSPAGGTEGSTVPSQQRRTGGLSVHGTVHAGGARPLADAVITLTDPAGRQVARGSSDIDGRYALEVPTGGTYLIITAAAHLSPHASLISVADRSLTHDISLTGRSALTGRVCSTDTDAVGGALVTLTDVTGRVVASTSSQDDGTYAFDALAAGSYVVTAQSGQHPPTALGITLADDTALTLDLPLVGAARLTGRVTAGSSGLPLPEALVALVDAEGHVVHRTTTDVHGCYSLDDLPPGEYTLTAASHAPASQTVVVSAGATDSADLHLGGLAPAEVLQR